MTANTSPTTGTIQAGRDVEQAQRDHVPDEAGLQRVQRPPASDEATELYGWLKEVNWAQRTAQFYRYSGECVRLRFGAALDDEMRRLTKRHVMVRGYTRFDQDDTCPTLQVEQIHKPRADGKPFDLEAFLNDPNPKVFDPDNVVTASEPFDVDEFIRIIHEARDAGREESLD